MNGRTLRVIAVLSFGAAGMVSWAGCAGSPTSKSTGEMIDDAAISTKVKTALLRDPLVSGLAVKVDTFKGTVQLHGFVDTDAQRTRAEQIARAVPGVLQVENALSVKAATTR